MIKKYLVSSLLVLLCLQLTPVNECKAEQSNALSSSGESQARIEIKEESLEDYQERMEWFVNAPYGMFIHFGLYSTLGGEWKGEPYDKYAEWIQAVAGIHREEYAEIINDFNPMEFDADFIVRTAKEAGMEYLVITAKHHEGFCLWDSEYTDFDVASSPFAGRDILAELKVACDKYGLKFGLYYSIIDWNHPAQEPDLESQVRRFRWKHTLLVEGREQEYIDYQTNQVLELIEKYQPAILWFDGDWADWWSLERGIELYNTIREADPDIIVNNRVARRDLFELDYITQEQNHFEDAFPKHWEGCYTMNMSWGYKKHDHDWKDAQTVYNKLKDINEKGGNLLLNVGPDGQGRIQPEALEILEETAVLLEENPIEKRIPAITRTPGIVDDSARAAWEKELLTSRDKDKPAYLYIENNPDLPNVLIYGDSISIAYTEEVRNQLLNEANVYRLHTNGGNSSTFIRKMKLMHQIMSDPHLDAPWAFDWDVIQFNTGLHDLTYRLPNGDRDKENGELSVSIEEYKQNLRDIIAYLHQLAPNARLIFATTTPVPEGEPGRVAGDAARYNAAALEVLAEYPDIIVNDLYRFTKPNQPKWWSEPGNVHYNTTGSTAQGKRVVEVIRTALPEE